MSNVAISLNALSEAEITARCITDKIDEISRLQMIAYANKDDGLFDDLVSTRAKAEKKLARVRSAIRVINRIYWGQRGSYVS